MVVKKIDYGRNNFVYKRLIKNKIVIFKKYNKKTSTKFSRQQTEKKFIKFLLKRKITNIPKIINFNLNQNITQLSFINGSHIKNVKKNHINSCIKFLLKINYNLKYENFKFQNASDACLSLQHHINCTSKRINYLKKKYSEDKDFKKKKIYNYLIKYIEPEFKHLKQKINKTFDAKTKKKKINRKQMILSPSDFGFHNILSHHNNLYYIDFEYAGWDDPYKLIADFILNPDYKIPIKYQNIFLAKFSKLFPNKFQKDLKFHFVKKLHFIKWVCVILNQIQIDILNKHDKYNYFIKAKNYFRRNKHILNELS